MCVCVCVHVCVCVCVHVCVCVRARTRARIAKWLEHRPGNQKFMWWPGVNWGSSPPSYNINGYLVFTREANHQLSLSNLVVLGLLWNLSSVASLRPGQFCGLLVLPQEDLPAQDSATCCRLARLCVCVCVHTQCGEV